MPIKITVRQFRANLADYLQQLADGIELEINGMTIIACTHDTACTQLNDIKRVHTKERVHIVPPKTHNQLEHALNCPCAICN